MEKELKYTISEAHLFFARTVNGEVWALLEKNDRSREEDAQLIAAAFASYYHWLFAGTGVNKQRGEYMIARAFLAIENCKEALVHATRCLEITRQEKQEMADFDIAFAYEIYARANSACGNIEVAREYKSKAEDAGKLISQKEDRELFFQDLGAGNWYNN